MGDSWDDEEFEVPDLGGNAAPFSAPVNWDDEDEVEIDKIVVAKPSAAQVEAQLKKAEEDELAFQTKMKLSLLEKETKDERKLRERRQVEEADNELAGELFSKPSSSKTISSSKPSIGIGSTILKTKQDHLSFGTTIAQKLEGSTAFNVAAFYKNLSKCLKDNKGLTTEILDEILGDITKIRTKHAAAMVTVIQKEKKTKSQVKKENDKHAEIFGSSTYADKYEDEYGGMEDDFM